MDEFFVRLRQRKLVQWVIAYVAASFGLIQILDIVGQHFGWLPVIMRVVIVAAAVGFFVTLVLAWYHGERGAQRMTGSELLILAALLAVGGAVAWRFALPEAADVATAKSTLAPDDKSIAVLAFTDLSPAHDQEYFSDGLSEELINTLGHAGAFKVMGRTSSFQFKNTKDDPRTIGQKLGVGYLVDGSVRKAADRVRIGVELVRADDGSNVWSDSYDRDLKDIFAVQSEIATAVTGQMQRSLGIAATPAPASKPADGRPPSGNVEAYQAYLQGQFHTHRNTAADFPKAIAFFKQAIALDPGYALAHAELAISSIYFVSAYDHTPEEHDALLALARAETVTALQLGPDLAEAHLAHGLEIVMLDGPSADAERELRRAVELAPNDPNVWGRLGTFLTARGDAVAALAAFDHAIALDPLARAVLLNRGALLGLTGRLDEAEASVRKLIELEPQAAIPHSNLAIIKLHQGDSAAAVAIAREETDPFWRQWALAITLFAHGDRKEADATLDALIRDDGADSAFQIAEVYAARKDPDAAFRWLDRAVEQKDIGVTGLYSSSLLLAYRDDPRYLAFARKVGLDPANAPALPPSSAATH